MSTFMWIQQGLQELAQEIVSNILDFHDEKCPDCGVLCCGTVYSKMESITPGVVPENELDIGVLFKSAL